ncbi:hypothetical protein U9M48_037226 [Paspalum notatum var. saurae]|uniref:Uncharacterized protein n=1 Tax=Paspalum notatum var. saurae TaxID=547442 RepID=A0AAQ3UEI4_PASNO
MGADFEEGGVAIGECLSVKVKLDIRKKLMRYDIDMGIGGERKVEPWRGTAYPDRKMTSHQGGRWGSDGSHSDALSWRKSTDTEEERVKAKLFADDCPGNDGKTKEGCSAMEEDGDGKDKDRQEEAVQQGAEVA